MKHKNILLVTLFLTLLVFQTAQAGGNVPNATPPLEANTPLADNELHSVIRIQIFPVNDSGQQISTDPCDWNNLQDGCPTEQPKLTGVLDGATYNCNQETTARAVSDTQNGKTFYYLCAERDYLPDVVAKEMNVAVIPPHDEALKAQAVAARTVLNWKIGNVASIIDNSTDFQAYEPNKSLYSGYDNEIRTAVNDTAGEFLYYNYPCPTAINPNAMCDVIDAEFGADMELATNDEHSTAPGFVKKPYLTGVQDPISTSGCYVSVSGSHDYGMSQRGAIRWAKGQTCPEGTNVDWPVKWEYKQILAHYYTGIEFKNDDANTSLFAPDDRWNLIWHNLLKTTQLNAGNPYSFQIQLQNTSSAAGWIDPNQVEIGYKWTQGTTEITAWQVAPQTDPQIPTIPPTDIFGNSMALGSTANVTVNFYAPPSACEPCTLHLDLRRKVANQLDNVGWFSLQSPAWPDATIDVTVNGIPTPTPIPTGGLLCNPASEYATCEVMDNGNRLHFTWNLSSATYHPTIHLKFSTPDEDVDKYGWVKIDGTADIIDAGRLNSYTKSVRYSFWAGWDNYIWDVSTEPPVDIVEDKPFFISNSYELHISIALSNEWDDIAVSSGYADVYRPGHFPPTPTPTPTITPTPTCSGFIGCTWQSILDFFSGLNGFIDRNWGGDTGGYSINSNKLAVANGSHLILWQTSYGADQFAFVTMSTVDQNGGEQNLILKSQSPTSASSGNIEVSYDAIDHVVRVMTNAESQGRVQRGEDIPATFVDGDQFTARARPDGMVEVYRNDQLIGIRDVTAWTYYSEGGYTGLSFVDSSDALLDDFGGGTVSTDITPTANVTFTPTSTETPTGTATFTPANTATQTSTPTQTQTNTPTVTSTSTLTYTPTQTGTITPTASGTVYTFSSQPNGTNGQDAYILKSDATTNYGNTTEIGIGEKNTATDTVARGLIKFDLSSIPADANIVSATLSLWTSTDLSNNDTTVNVYRLKVPFNETQVNWNRSATGVNWQTAGASGANDRESSSIGSIQILANETIGVEKQISIDPAKVQEMVSGTFNNNGFLLSASGELDDRFMFKSSDNSTSSQRPKLVIQYTSASTTPAATITVTPSRTPTITNTPTVTRTPTVTATPVSTSTPTLTKTPTISPTATPAGFIFDNGFESGNLSAWSWNRNDGGDLSASTQASAIGSYGMAVLLDDAAHIDVTDSSPNAEKHYSTRFYLNPNTINLPNDKLVYIFTAEQNAVGWVACLDIKRFGEYYRLASCTEDDSGIWKDGGNVYITNAWQAVELEWQASSAPGANNGYLKLWVNDVLVDTISNLDNDTQAVDQASIGAPSDAPDGLSGTIYFDGFVSYNGSHIGLDPNGPAVSAPMSDLSFKDDFESGDLSMWSDMIGGSDLSISSSAALEGLYGMQALINDTTPNYVVDYSPKNEKDYRARFYFDPNSITIPTGNGFSIFTGSGQSSNYRIMLVNEAGGYKLQAWAMDDSSTWVEGALVSTTDEPQLIEVEYKAASSAGTNDGYLTLWLNDTAVDTVANLDNDTRLMEYMSFGAVGSIDSGTSGTIYFDAFEAHRSTHIGPLVRLPANIFVVYDSQQNTTSTSYSQIFIDHQVLLQSFIKRAFNYLWIGR